MFTSGGGVNKREREGTLGGVRVLPGGKSRGFVFGETLRMQAGEGFRTVAVEGLLHFIILFILFI